MLRKFLVVILMGSMAWAYQAIQPPPPNICGSPNGPPITSPRIKLRDGRHLAYKEHGVPKDKAKYKIVYVHGFDSCRHDALPLSQVPLSLTHIYWCKWWYSWLIVWYEFQKVAEELGVYFVSFDRAGYGESDPNPKRTVKSTPLDIEELADQLELGSKFYVIGFSMGGQIVWSCLKYISHRYDLVDFLLFLTHILSSISSTSHMAHPYDDPIYNTWILQSWNKKVYLYCIVSKF